MAPLPASELILNPDGSVYHLHLQPDQIGQTIITVGDPDRVDQVSRHFDRIDTRVQKREFITHTGELNGKRLSVISTGIGTDNIDIVINELDALVNIDLDRREIRNSLTTLDIIRIGTSGALQSDLLIDSFLISEFAVGMDGLMHYYDFNNNANEHMVQHEFMVQVAPEIQLPVRPYFAEADAHLLQQIGLDMRKGITLTCTGFYAPQGRTLRYQLKEENLLEAIRTMRYRDLSVTNLEMETAGIYGMARLLGHRAVSCNAILANRFDGSFSKQPQETVDALIQTVLERV